VRAGDEQPDPAASGAVVSSKSLPSKANRQRLRPGRSTGGAPSGHEGALDVRLYRPRDRPARRPRSRRGLQRKPFTPDLGPVPGLRRRRAASKHCVEALRRKSLTYRPNRLTHPGRLATLSPLTQPAIAESPRPESNRSATALRTRGTSHQCGTISRRPAGVAAGAAKSKRAP